MPLIPVSCPVAVYTAAVYDRTMKATDYASDAPDFAAWAGTGPNVTRIHESGDHDAMAELRARYNRTISQWVENDVDPGDAMAAIDVESIAGDICDELALN